MSRWLSGGTRHATSQFPYNNLNSAYLFRQQHPRNDTTIDHALPFLYPEQAESAAAVDGGGG